MKMLELKVWNRTPGELTPALCKYEVRLSDRVVEQGELEHDMKKGWRNLILAIAQIAPSAPEWWPTVEAAKEAAGSGT